VRRSRPRRGVGGGGALGVLLLAVLAGCGSEVGGAADERPASRIAAPAPGDTFIEAQLGNISGLIPNITSDSASHAVGALLYDGLIKYDKDLNPMGDLAESWTYSPDCLDLTFRLRRNVRWHDGLPFTADDVAFTYRTMIHPKTPSSYKDDFLVIERLETPDPYTVRVRYPRPHAKALLSWSTTAMLPRHLLERYVEEGRLRDAPQNWHDPVGTGAYRFKQMRSGEKIVLVANPDYYAGRPYLSRVVFRVIPSQATIFLELKAKGLDHVSTVTALQYRRQTEYPAFRKAFNKFRYPSNAFTYVAFNLKDPRFRDQRVRHAFALAINKSEVIQGVRLGLAREVTGPFRHGSWAYNPNVPPIPYDPARARRLLAEAGWRDTDGDGVLDKGGRPFSFELITNQGNEERKKIAEIVQSALNDLGVQVEVRVIEWSVFIKEHIRKRRFDMMVMGWGLGLDPDQYNLWHSSKTAPEDFNFVSYANPEVDELLEKGRASCVQSERARYYHRIHEILAADQPLIFLYNADTLPVVASRVHGIDPSPNGILHNFTQWYVPKELQRYTSE
jgi:peptide/nickel transport system substrate-binding protein